MTAARFLEQYPFQLLVAMLFFGCRMKGRSALFHRRIRSKVGIQALFWGKVALLGMPMLLVYDAGMRRGVTTGNVALDYVILLLPVLYTTLLMWVCRECGLVDSLYYTVTATAAQNLVFNLYWIVITYLGFAEGTAQSVLVALPIMVAVYVLVYVLFSRKLREFADYPFAQGRVIAMAAMILLFVVVLNRRILDTEHQYGVYWSYVLGDIFCLLLLFGLFYESGLKQKYRIMEQLLYAEQKKQQMSRENIELINRKCHDLKHQIGALRMMGESREREEYIREIEKAAVFYESSAKTGCQMLDLLLMEKLLYCEKYGIKLSCIAEGEKLKFMDVMDLYSLFGNALDNAIESVMQEEDERNRIISFKVASRGEILSIHFENYVGRAPEFVDGLPVTTKRDKKYHGFGMLSMRHIVEKYGGTMQIAAKEHLFQMNILLPIPEGSAGGR